MTVASMLRTTSCTFSSVRTSMFAVASSHRRMRGGAQSDRRGQARLGTSTLARVKSCRSPTEKFWPATSTWKSSASGNDLAFSSRPTTLKQCHRTSSPWSTPAPIVRFCRSVPERRKASCETTRTLVRSVCSGRRLMSTPSTSTLPAARGYKRFKALNKELLPQPVRPQKASFELPGILKSMPFSTREWQRRYRMATASSRTSPMLGHTSSAPPASPAPSALTSPCRRTYSATRSTDTNFVSTSAAPIM
mmetsp:Transcript_16307/g.37031  ORF Transcript_16307/g.37031 Transcript_16307/m.37031 type:complete len:249 (-) Transcript_16307:364-1110(-)